MVDQVMQATPFWYYMKQNHRIVMRGGEFIEDPLRYGKNDSIRGIGRGDTVTIVDSDPSTMSKWPWKYVTGHIYRTFQDDQVNRGEAKFLDLVQTKIETLQDSYAEKMEMWLFDDGTADGGKVPNGLLNLVPYAPATGTVGNLNRATYSWWRNYATDMTTQNPVLWLRTRLTTMWNNTMRWGAGDRLKAVPDFIITTQAIAEIYEDMADAVATIILKDNMKVGRGFGQLVFKGIPVNWSPYCPDYALWMLNTEYLKFTVDDIENFTLGEWIPIADQPGARVAHALFVCNLTISNCRHQGAIYNIDN